MHRQAARPACAGAQRPAVRTMGRNQPAQPWSYCRGGEPSMSNESDPNETRAGIDPAASDHPGDCPLSAREQTRNLVLYGINVTLVYLAAPVVYVGLMQAALLEKLGASKM